MKYEDRIQLKVDELTTAFFDHVIAYYLSKPSGLGGPGCVIMVSDEGKSYQFHGPELDQLNYYSEWQLLFPILRKYLKDGRRLDDTQQVKGWKSFKVGYIGEMLILREDLYPSYLENRGNLSKYGLDTQWEEACIKIALLANAKSEGEIGYINWHYELRKRKFRRGDLVSFTVKNDKKEWLCQGRIVRSDIYRSNFKIETIEYDIWGPDYLNVNEKILYKHIDESMLKKAPGHMIVITGEDKVEKEKVIRYLTEKYPDKYAWYKDNHWQNAEETIFKECYEGKIVLLDMEREDMESLKKDYPHVRDICVAPLMYEGLTLSEEGKNTLSENVEDRADMIHKIITLLTLEIM